MNSKSGSWILAVSLAIATSSGCSDDAASSADAAPAADSSAPTADASEPGVDAGNGCDENAAEAPIVEIVFPPQPGVTDVDSVTLRGTASDASTIARVEVDGMSVESNDGFATWQLQVSLELGENHFTVVSEDDEGNRNCTAAQIEVAQLPGMDVWPWAIAVDAAGGRAFIGDDELYNARVVSMDLTTGYRTVITGPGVGSGPTLSGVEDVAYDPLGGRVLVSGSGQIVAVDIATGARTVIASSTVGSGPAPSPSGPIVLDAVNNRAIMAKASSQAPGILAIDLSTGDRTSLSDDDGVGGGPLLETVLAMDIDLDSDPANPRVLVTNDEDQLLAVDLLTGDRTLLATGTWNAESMVYDSANNRALVIDYHRFNGMSFSEEQAIMAIDLASGQTTVVSDIATGTGPLFQLPEALGLDPLSDRAFVTDRARGYTFAVDLTNGDRTVFSATQIGGGPRPFVPSSAYADPANNRLVAWSGPRVTAMDLATGDRSALLDTTGGPFRVSSVFGLTPYNNTLVAAHHAYMAPYVISFDLATGQYRSISDASTGNGPILWNIAGLALDAANQRALIGSSDEIAEEVYEGLLVWVDLNSGDRTVMASDATGAGLLEPTSVIIDEANNRALVFDRGANDEEGSVVAVDLTTGSGIVLSSDAVGSGPTLDEHAVFSMVHDTENNRLIMALIFDEEAVIAVDLATGDRTVLSQRGVLGRGPALKNPWGLVMHESGEYVYVGDRGLLAMVAIDVVTGDRVMVSR